MSEEKAVMTAPPPPLPLAPDLSALVPPKRKKGRPPKNRDLMPGGENTTGPQPPKPDGRGRKSKRKNGDMGSPSVDNAFVGQQVHGVLDGSFDAGYLLTVRVGNTQTVLRGAVFEPTLSVPISNANDIAPHVKFINRSEQMAALPWPEQRAANPALPSPVVPPVISGNVRSVPPGIAPTESTPLATKEERRSEPSSMEPGSMPSVVATESHKEAVSSAKDYVTEGKVDLYPEQHPQEQHSAEGHVP